eukprot:5940413-Alexandrium_andersonii.AAC.1
MDVQSKYDHTSAKSSHAPQPAQLKWFQSARIGRACGLGAHADWTRCGFNLRCGLKAAIGRVRVHERAHESAG